MLFYTEFEKELVARPPIQDRTFLSQTNYWTHNTHRSVAFLFYFVKDYNLKVGATTDTSFSDSIGNNSFPIKQITIDKKLFTEFSACDCLLYFLFSFRK